MPGRSRVVIRKAAMEELAQSRDVEHALVDRANQTQARAKENAPVSAQGSHGRNSGYLRGNIRIKYARDSKGVYSDVVSTARTPKGFPYGRLQEQRHPYLKPAIE
jgi:hypothetical protein